MIYPIFTSRWSVGLTFVTWSYHWLMNHEDFWNARDGLCRLVNNPNTGINAHGFNKNHRAGYEKWCEFLQDTTNRRENCSLYGGPLRFDDVSTTNKDYAKCMTLASSDHPLILFVESAQDPWYFLIKRDIDPGSDNSVSTTAFQSHADQLTCNWIDQYFSDAARKFGDSLWDRRELIALNFDYLKVDRSYLDCLDRSISHLYIDSRDLWYNGERCMEKIFDYVDRSISVTRLRHWRDVYRTWQKTQIQISQFNWYLETIVDCIINNWDFDMRFLKLNLLQEAVIQGYLIRQHDINIRGHGLKKFPKNTRLLYKLLIPNVHQSSSR